jgi:hypothetical protein
MIIGRIRRKGKKQALRLQNKAENLVTVQVAWQHVQPETKESK